MRGVIVHAALLFVMLIYGYQTWTRDKGVKPTAGEVVMWNRSEGDLKTIEFATADRTLRLERRGDGAAAYWWGVESRTTKKLKPKDPPPPPADPAAPPPPPEAPEYVDETTTREFPIGEPGEKLVKDLARMRAIKSLGVVKDDGKQAYELVDTSKTITVMTKDGGKTLVLGGRVYGGSDRYVLDVDSGKAFVVLGSLITPLEGGEGALRPTDIRGFDAKAAMAVEIAAGGKTKVVNRIKVKKPDDDKAAPNPHAPAADDEIETWGTGQTADTAAANFIDKVEKLRPSSFEAKLDPKTLGEVVKLTYRDGRGQVLGTFQVLKQEKPGEPPPVVDPTKPPEPPAPTVEYYVLTERTRVPAPVPKVAAERIVPDITTIFPN